MNNSRVAILATMILGGSVSAAGLLTPQEFVARALAAGQSEVEMAMLALDKSRAADIRAFAQKMVDDHGSAGMELAGLARAKGLPAAKPTEAQQAVLAELRKKSGKDFDKAYAERMVKDHDEAVALFSAAGTLDDAELVGFARKTLPVLSGHQEMARQLGRAH